MPRLIFAGNDVCPFLLWTGKRHAGSRSAHMVGGFEQKASRKGCVDSQLMKGRGRIAGQPMCVRKGTRGHGR